MLPRASLSAGLSRFFALAHGAQTASVACIAAAEGECAHLQQQQDVLRRNLEALPKEAHEDEEQLLVEMAQTLNNQKRRCRKLWEASCQNAAAEGPEVDLDPATVSLVEAPATISLEECLDREQPPAEAVEMAGSVLGGEVCDLSAGSAPSLVFASESLHQPLSAEAGGEGSAFTFTIPLTLGMGDYSHTSLKASSKRSATAENLLAPGSVRRRVASTL